MNRVTIFSVTLERHADVLHLKLTGELDLGNLLELTTALPDLAPGDTLVVDLRELEFIDSSGIHVLMRLDTDARRGGWSVALVRAPATVQRVLDICRLSDRMRTVDSPGDISPALA